MFRYYKNWLFIVQFIWKKLDIRNYQADSFLRRISLAHKKSIPFRPQKVKKIWAGKVGAGLTNNPRVSWENQKSRCPILTPCKASSSFLIKLNSTGEHSSIANRDEFLRWFFRCIFTQRSVDLFGKEIEEKLVFKTYEQQNVNDLSLHFSRLTLLWGFPTALGWFPSVYKNISTLRCNLAD